MRKIWMTMTAAALALAMAGAYALATPVKAKLMGVKGDVTAKVSADAAWEAAAEGASLPEGASVKTGADGEVNLVWPGGSAVKVFPLSVVKLDASRRSADGGSKTELDMQQGRTLSKVAKLQTTDSVFSVKTPTAVAGVRGTTFDTSIDPASAAVSVAVVSGSVFVAVGDIEVAVAEGFASTVAAGEPPAPPAAIPPERMQQLQSDSDELGETAESEAAGEAEEARAQKALRQKK